MQVEESVWVIANMNEVIWREKTTKRVWKSVSEKLKKTVWISGNLNEVIWKKKLEKPFWIYMNLNEIIQKEEAKEASLDTWTSEWLNGIISGDTTKETSISHEVI